MKPDETEQRKLETEAGSSGGRTERRWDGAQRWKKGDGAEQSEDPRGSRELRDKERRDAKAK